MSKTMLWIQLAAAGLLLILLILSDFGLFFPVRNFASRILIHALVLELISISGLRLLELSLDEMDEMDEDEDE